MRRASWHGLALALLVAVAAAACGSQAPSLSSPSGSPVAGPIASPDASAWLRAPDIEQPFGFMQVHTDASGNPYTRGCAPCHPAVDTEMTDVVAGPAGLVAVGWVFQDFKGASWSSTDGATWKFNGDFANETVLSAVASNDTRYVAVGRSGRGATAWSSSDGSTWQQTTSTSAFADTPLRMTSVVRWQDGFVAGGFKGSEFFSADGAFWVSRDGLTWQRAADSGGLHDARVASITTGGPGLVAVGQAGPADHPGPALVWTSADGLHWQRVADAAPFHDLRMQAVANVPAIGIVAVGQNLAGSTGAVLLSNDGLHWKKAPSSPVFGRPGIQLRMYDVTSGPYGAVIVGTVTTGIQYGEAAVWTSTNGIGWTRLPSELAFLDTEMNAATKWASKVVAAGNRGAPDAYQATAWVSPADLGR